jgi:hypothetical protein
LRSCWRVWGLRLGRRGRRIRLLEGKRGDGDRYAV